MLGRMRTCVWLARAVVLASSFAGPVLAEPERPAAPPPSRPHGFISVREVRPGMTGYGLTVFEGTKPDRFDVRVIGVMHNYRPLEDIILIRSEDPRLKHSGAVAGMSGSPIYIEGKLAGAFAYGFPFAKDMIAGVTPIEYMLKEVHRPRRGPDPATGMARGQVALQGGRDVPSSFWTEALRDSTEPWWRQLLPHRQAPNPSAELVRAQVPLSAAGFGGQALEELQTALKPFGLVPFAGVGGGRPPNPKGPTEFHPGDAIGVELVRGDMSMVGTGTVTYVEGNSVAGFGHPMFGAGEVYLPVATAEIHTFLPSLAMSFKLSSPLREAGTLVQDRESGIVADTSQRTAMVPVRISLSGLGGETRVFSAEVARFRFIMPMLVGAVVTSAITSFASDITHVVARVHSRLQVHSQAPLEMDDHFYAADGLAGRTLAQVSSLRAIGEILFNPFEPVAIDRLDVAIELAFRPDFAEIVSLRTNAGEVEPGSRVNLYVTLRPFGGPEYVETVPLEIPKILAGQTLKIEAAAGNLVRPDMAPPENLKGLVDNLRKSYSARSIVVTLQTPGEGASIRGKLLPDLPSSEIDTLRPSASTRRGDPYRRFSRIQKPLARVLTGKQEITVTVKNELSK